MNISKICIAVAAALALISGCTATRDFTLGNATTQDQRAYRAMLVYTELANLAETKAPAQLERAAFGAITALHLAALDKATSAKFEVVAKSVRNQLRLLAAGSEIKGLPFYDLKSAALHLARTGAVTAEPILRIRRTMNAMSAEARGPTVEEWEAAVEAASEIHARIQRRG